MDSNVEKIIIKEYKKGKSSLQIAEIVGYSKPTILKVLHKHNLVRKRDRCKKFKYEFKNGYYILYHKCPSCKKFIPTKSKDKIICCRNHITKINNMTDCKSCSLEKQKGEGNPFYGKKHTKNTKKKISKSRKGKAKGEYNAMSNPIHRQRATTNLKQKWDKGEMEHARKIMSDTMKNSIRSGKLKNVNKSKTESVIKSLIESYGYYVIHSYRVDTKICDLYIPELNLVLEYNGDYWHCNPKKYESNYFNQKKSKYAWEIWEYDQSKVDLIKSYGYNVEVVWEDNFKTNDKIIKEILYKHDKNK